MKSIYRIDQHLKKQIKLMFALVMGVVFYSQSLSQADYGFRVEKMEVELSQKFPPFIAYELLDQESIPENTIPDPDIIELKVGFPELAPIQLEELSFGALEDLNKKAIVKVRPRKVSLDNLEETDFTDEEKTRLRMAKIESGLEIEDLLPRHEISFSERAQALINLEKNNSAKVKEAAKLLSEKETEATRTVTVNGDLKVGNWLRGEIEFVRDGSLAMTDQHVLDVRRFEEGVPKEVAQVDLSNGTFALNIKTTKGVIVGRLTNSRGGIEGEGTLAVADLVTAKNSKLVLKRLASKNPIRSNSAYGKNHFDKDANLTMAGYHYSSDNSEGKPPSYNINSFDPTSEVVAEAQSKNHRPTISMVNLMGGAELVMLPERMVEGLIEILSEQDIPLDLDRGDALIWGTVRWQGRPVEGATVIASQGRISYFGGMYLPDQTRSQTSANGMFAIAVHQAGWNDLYFELPNGKNVHVNALVYPGKVTQVVADIPDELVPVTLRTFDAFSGEPVRARLEIQQLNEVVDTGSEGAIVTELPKTRSLSFITATAESPYESIRVAYSNFLDYLHLPMFSKSWIDGLRTNIKINEELQTGNIVGFVQGDNFIVEIPNNETLAKTIYFDQQGQIIERGMAGGGFVIFNLEEALANIVIVSEHNEREIGRIVRPDRQFIQVISASFE